MALRAVSDDHPWLAFLLSVLGLVGTGKASINLFNAFRDGLSEDQQQELRNLTFDTGITLRRLRSAYRT